MNRTLCYFAAALAVIITLRQGELLAGRFGGGGFHGGFGGGGGYRGGFGGGGYHGGFEGGGYHGGFEGGGFGGGAYRGGFENGGYRGGFEGAEGGFRDFQGGGGFNYSPMSRPQSAFQESEPAVHQYSAVSGLYGGDFNRGDFNGGSAHYAYSGPRGGVVIGGGAAGEITGPGGNSAAAAEHGHVVIGPNGNVHGSGARGAAVKTPSGEAVAGGRAGFSAGPNGAVAHGQQGIAGRGTEGEFAAGGHAAVATGPYGAVAAGGRYAAGRGTVGQFAAGTHFVSASDLNGQGAVIRTGFGCYNCFRPGWYARYPGAWAAAAWIAGNAWSAATWADCQTYCGYAADTSPYYYDYGDTVTYQDNNVCYNGQPVATQTDYATQAEQIVQSAPVSSPATDDKWRPLGVFAMAQGDETMSNDILQLAINQAGAVRGNYYNAISDTAVPLAGGLDKKTQRVAWSINNNNNVVYETGLYNLTLDQTTMLVHFGKDSTKQYRLFRVQQPEKQSTSAP